MFINEFGNGGVDGVLITGISWMPVNHFNELHRNQAVWSDVTEFADRVVSHLVSHDEDRDVQVVYGGFVVISHNVSQVSYQQWEIAIRQIQKYLFTKV